MALQFPAIDPAMVRIGPFAIRWYAVAYIVGLIGGWRYTRWLVGKPPFAMTLEQVDDFLVWATAGVVLGGRLGYVLFYKPLYYLANPLETLMVWQGGMSFHGGALGVIAAIVLFSRRNRLHLLAVGDVICTVVPMGLLFGRIANFVNGELFGRPAPEDLPWAMIFPGGGPVARHPSQLYEAGLEGLVLLVVMHILWRQTSLRLRSGFLSGAFLTGYGLARIVGEFFRQPDANLGFLWGGATMGQLLSLPLLVVGALLMARAKQPT
ncbi:prolipoprotein diacylglyceryl transferase [Telmatospirillum siberiense]|uniref:Phosphatidylglycerol--prolipoprotein diacylglyceryl transferase n=1 Tax=Telmatospirillum siberiense TaxID=382514 RepID=A0A2N3PU58_9PROT|nr:prolipoprotein diacylglyceryl transferase [Telmatospirillum siberiense]PKU23935.1 prolipoprotein diacylglyceryl transferase [Telmatospirillum siberiense]